MAPRTFVALTCFSLLSVVAGLLCKASASSVLDYSDLDLDSLKEEINKHDLIFVDFYFSWCQAAKEFEPKFAEAAEILAEDDLPVPFAKFNCYVKAHPFCKFAKDLPICKTYTNRRTICKDFAKMEKSPTVRIYRRGQMIEYSGELEMYDLVGTASDLLEDIRFPDYKEEDEKFDLVETTREALEDSPQHESDGEENEIFSLLD